MARVFILIKRQLRTFNCKCSASKKDLKKKTEKKNCCLFYVTLATRIWTLVEIQDNLNPDLKFSSYSSSQKYRLTCKND